jgi:hypothetical protein
MALKADTIAERVVSHCVRKLYPVVVDSSVCILQNGEEIAQAVRRRRGCR